MNQEPTEMNHDDDRLRALLHDAVSDVAPRDGLAEVRRRTRRRSTHRWAPVLLGAGAVAATVVAATLVVRGLGDSAPPDDTTAASSPSADADRFVAGIYFVGTSPTGERLYREFQSLPAEDDEAEQVRSALERLTFEHGAADPDYRTLWPTGSFADVRLEPDRVVVVLGTEAALQPSDRTGAGALGVQQAVYTAEAVIGDTLPVTFEWQDRPAPRVLGVEVDELEPRDTSYSVTAPVNISDPAEGDTVEDVLVARGTMGFDVSGEVRWSIAAGGDVVSQGVIAPETETSEGTAPLGIPAWETEIDVSDLAPGDYVLEVTTTSTGQTSDTPATFSDTRTFTVR